MSASDAYGAEASAALCWEFFEALTAKGFNADQAALITAAWMGRPNIDMAAYNAVMENFAERMVAP